MKLIDFRTRFHAMTDEPMTSRGTVVMAGMPKTGKSTFLGALYHVLEAESGSSIALDVLPDARQHLEGLRKRWLRVEPEGRTSSVSPVLNDLTLRTDETGRVLSLRWPDLSGEYFDDMVRKRTLNAQVAKILEEATALLIFVHPDTVTQQPRIYEVNRAAASAGSHEGNQTDNEETDDATEPQEIEWDPMMVPGQILTVELLQMLLDVRFAYRICRISIIVSAWDVVPSHVPAPKEYVRSQLPLLDQFLQANVDRCHFRMFGVSALGGDPENDKEMLQAKMEPVQRIQVVDEDGAPVADGILAPLRWLIE